MTPRRRWHERYMDDQCYTLHTREAGDIKVTLTNGIFRSAVRIYWPMRQGVTTYKCEASRGDAVLADVTERLKQGVIDHALL